MVCGNASVPVVTESTEFSLRIILPVTESVPFVIVRVADPERVIFPTTAQSPCMLVAPTEAARPDDGQLARTGPPAKPATNIKTEKTIFLSKNVNVQFKSLM